GHSDPFGASSCFEQPHDFTRVLVQTVAEQGVLDVPEIPPIPALSLTTLSRSNSVISSVFWVIPKPLGHIRVANSHMTLPESWFKPLRNRENLKFPEFVRFLDFAPQTCAFYNSVISSVFWVIPKPLGHIRVANSHMTLPESC